MSEGRYRTRTAIRERLPWCLLWLAPKSKRDCGDHELYRHAGDVWHCYHCVGAVRKDRDG